MLNNFFRINLPYGIAKSQDDKWMAFNREYMPLGFNDVNYKEHPGYSYKEMPIYTKYKRLTENFLTELAGNEKFITRNSEGEITKIFFYDDTTNPVNGSKSELWENYFSKIQKLAKFEKTDIRY
ncbi:MAG TPA: hypothetical protein VKY82_02635 [Flavobacterium sp.]|nr:hypothetical protein [Flavobacterium sp.]